MDARVFAGGKSDVVVHPHNKVTAVPKTTGIMLFELDIRDLS